MTERNLSALIKATVEDAPIALLCLDPERRVLYANEEGRRLESVSCELERAYRDAVIDGQHAGEYFHEGLESWYSVKVVPSEPYAVLWAWDITPRKLARERLEQSERRKAAMLDACLDGVMSVDAAGRILELNAPAERMFGWTQDEALGRHVGRLLVPPAELPVRERNFQKLVEMPDGQATEEPVELTLLHKDGTPVPVEATAARATLEDEPILIAFYRDLSHARQAEAELARALELRRRSEEETILRLARAAELHDEETGRHNTRMGNYAGLLAAKAGFDPDSVALIRLASVLHDVGKIGVPDSILLKPGPLTTDERKLMDRHTVIGHRLLAGSDSPLLELAATIALTHHERVDGEGQPYGLKGDEIAIEGRIAAVADVFDALLTDRPYRGALPLEAVVAEMSERAGSHLDAELVGLLLDSLDEVEEIRRASGGSFDPAGTPAGPRSAHGELTPRQTDVLRLLSGGASTDQIASELYLSKTTVRNHISKILHALGVHSRLAAVAKARREGLVND